MNAASVQTRLFQHLRSQLPAHLSMVDEVAEVLQISIDSAYRRIRGEKPLDVEELSRLCRHYRVSMDHLLHLEADSFLFSGQLADGSDLRFGQYLENMHAQFQYVNQLESKHLYYLMKDIPPFVHFQVEELATFKFFFWMKSLMHFESLKGVKFDFQDPRYAAYRVISRKIIQLYNQVPTTEIWNIESINSTLRQIDFYRRVGAFKSKDDTALLYTKFSELMSHMERQADLGIKFNIGEEPAMDGAEYHLYVNELILGDNTVMLQAGDTLTTFLNHSVLYFISTRNEQFNRAMFNNLKNLLKRSTMISKTGEKERAGFFNRVQQIIRRRLELL
ncbi:MAG TPA: helix-turn-helix domain-containing protein [Chryseolinea sp.]|nr:helix-turn-helix domain-containing protein [Chryseolinea sp.]